MTTYTITISGCTLEEWNRVCELLQKNMGFRVNSPRLEITPEYKKSEKTTLEMERKN